MLSYREFSDPKRATQLGIGLSSPLWGAFALTASAGMAWWAWSRWGRTALEGVGEAGPRDVTAPPAASAKTPDAERPSVEAAPEPKSFEAEAPKTIAEPVIDKTVAVAPPVPEPVAAPKLAPKKAAAPKASAPKPAVAKADAPKPAKAAKAPSVRKPEPAAAKPRSSARRKTVRHH